VALQKGGAAKAQASCHTPLMENSYVYPESERIKRLRRNILELVLTDYPEEKFRSNGRALTELQIVAANLGVTHADIRYPPGKNHFMPDRMKATPTCARTCPPASTAIAASGPATRSKASSC
jgi:formate dehydrogenase major subunit